MREHWLKRLRNINWSFNRASDAVGFLSYLRINDLDVHGACVINLRNPTLPGTMECTHQKHESSYQAWENWELDLPEDTCGCTETRIMSRLIGATLNPGLTFGYESHVKTMLWLGDRMVQVNSGLPWVLERRPPLSFKEHLPVILELGNDGESAKVGIWMWVEIKDGQNDVKCYRVEGKLAKLCPKPVKKGEEMDGQVHDEKGVEQGEDMGEKKDEGKGLHASSGAAGGLDTE